MMFHGKKWWVWRTYPFGRWGEQRHSSDVDGDIVYDQYSAGGLVYWKEHCIKTGVKLHKRFVYVSYWTCI